MKLSEHSLVEVNTVFWPSSSTSLFLFTNGWKYDLISVRKLVPIFKVVTAWNDLPNVWVSVQNPELLKKHLLSYFSKLCYALYSSSPSNQFIVVCTLYKLHPHLATSFSTKMMKGNVSGRYKTYDGSLQKKEKSFQVQIQLSSRGNLAYFKAIHISKGNLAHIYSSKPFTSQGVTLSKVTPWDVMCSKPSTSQEHPEAPSSQNPSSKLPK